MLPERIAGYSTDAHTSIDYIEPKKYPKSRTRFLVYPCLKYVFTLQVLISIPPHQHLIPLLACFETKKYLYLVLQQAEHGDLFQYIQAKLVPEGGLRCLMNQLVLALEHLHLHRHIHGDVKPENVLLLPTAHEDRPHLLLAS